MKVLKQLLAGVGIAVLLAGCGTGGDGQDATRKQSVLASAVTGDMTYQDVLQKGGYVTFVTVTSDGGRIWLGTHAGLYVSAGDKLWSLASNDVAQDEATGLFIDPSQPKRMFVGTRTAFKLSTDGGKSWKNTPGKGLPKQPEIHSFAGVREGNQIRLFAYVNDEGIYQSADAGEHWQKWLSFDQDVTSMLYQPRERRLYAVAQDGLYSGTSDLWEKENLPDVQQVYSVAMDPQDGSLYVATDRGILVKRDGAWTSHPVKVPEKLMMLAAGSGQLVAVGESAFLYTLQDHTWKKWE